MEFPVVSEISKGGGTILYLEAPHSDYRCNLLVLRHPYKIFLILTDSEKNAFEAYNELQRFLIKK